MQLSTLRALLGEYPNTKKIWKKLTVLLIIFVLLLSSEPFFYKYIIQAFQDSWSIWILSGIIILWIVTSIATIGIRYLYGITLLDAANYDSVGFCLRGMKQYRSLPIEYHRNVQNGEKQNALNRADEFVWAFLDTVILEILPQILMILILIVSGFIIAPMFMTVLLFFVPVITVGVYYAWSTAHSKQKMVNKYWDKLHDRLSDGFVNLLITRVFSRSHYEDNELHHRAEKASIEQKGVRRFWLIFGSLGKFFTLFIRAIAIIVGVLFLRNGHIDLATFFFFISLADRIFSPLLMICDNLGQLYQNSAHYEKMLEVFALDSERDIGVWLIQKVKKWLEITNLSFSYPSNHRKVLDNVSISFPRWSHTAIIGHTGSGKSTITQLLLRLYDYSDGSIKLDDHEITDYALENYRSLFGVVFQDTTLFNDSVRHNLSYVRDDITEKDIIRACKEAHLDEFLSGLPDWLDTVVGERGLKLSGGERQRLAIARTILANPQILILDEATSALDTKTERQIQDAFDHLMKWRTSIVIAHRLSTIMHADQIILMDHGKVIAYWSHEELYKISEVYREMVDMQKDGYLQDEEEADEITLV